MTLARKSAKLLILALRARRRFRSGLTRSAFAQFGKHFRFDPDGSYTYSTIHVGDDVSLGIGAVLWAVAPAYIEIRDKVIFGPNVTVMAGDHVMDVSGAFMADLHEKRPGDDMPVIIERDVWIGANAIVLKGVTIGRGSVVGSGSVVTRSVEPYSIVCGVPARKLRDRFTPNQVREHEEFLGPEKPLPGL